MKKNNSPWLHQLKRTAFFPAVEHDINTDITVVGAGIAGVSTAFFLLTTTEKKVLLLEANKIARGATGHNAGQVVSYFERSFADIVTEFGLEKAGNAQKAIEDSWMLLDQMYTTAGLTIPFSRFIGHAGLSSYDQVITHLKDSLWRKRAQLPLETFRISEQATFLKDIPDEYHGLYEVVPHEIVLGFLESKERSFNAVISYQKGCLNSALFCEEVIAYLCALYPERFEVHENTMIAKVVLKHDYALLDAGKATVTTRNVVLCTNGFDTLTILNESGLDIDTRFHHDIKATVGYMSGYLEDMNKPPVAISYFTNPDASSQDPYFYFTRRQYEYSAGTMKNLISIGGPEVSLDDKTSYSRDLLYPDSAQETIDAFIKSVYELDPNKKIDYQFTWHGLMGYTPNLIRRVGFEPKNHVLMYNLGCNGIGILPSVFGGKRIADLINGATDSTIFDPQ